ncbi:protein of unknown function [Algoriella xinjiangensis]|uniref:DUF4328 domain-containing protein n=1 Tax=Algoriella xinjiangensis TaxID=684065 RepID=A0A1I4W4I9_9FLAO|nr:DUF4328 domain-containing protein [Algoriella xinjiangensis]SFN08352.1 protein of unknown function [Algoriella xinjiangensis]VDH15712.1 Uncharacterised protein [Algoriella xinjiangensis]
MNENELNFENYRSNSERKKNVILSFYIAFVFIVISFLIGIYYYFELNKYANAEIEDVSTLEMVYSISGVLQVLSIIGTMIFFVLWFRRAYANLSRVGLSIDNNDNMAFWGFVIPFMNFVKPLKIAKEIDLKYDYLLHKFNENHVSNLNNYNILIAWWIAYWIENVVSRIATKINYDSIDQALYYQKLILVSDVVSLVSISLTILMIKTLSRSEQELEQYLKLEELSTNNIILS